ncbi:nuclear transport factor 2 family protein [Robiginitalea sp. IMCC44478]|uniref:nuclear transport factor 2 family protein n=1 Tax=Robiginitalea sp. IMCC44478 TaxID=3459122 RepID=UPI004042F2F7
MIRYLIVFTLWVSMGMNAQQTAEQEVSQLLDQWHKAAAQADFEGYFNAMAEGANFIGTDATENWDKKEFMAFSKPYFDQGKAWSFSALERNIYIGASAEVAWFDELLDTWMQLCRGSGVAVRQNGEWKIAHYVLSLTVPNEKIEGAIALKKESDSLLMQQLAGIKTN